MPSSPTRWLRSSTFSLVLLIALQGTSCFEFDSTTRFEPDGSGVTSVEVALNMAMLEMLVGEEFSSDDLDPASMERELTEDMRTAADTLPGVTLDTAYAVDEGGWRRLYTRLTFEDPAALAGIFQSGAAGLEDEAGGEPAPGPTIELVDGTVHVTHTPRGLGGRSSSDRMSQMLAMNLIEGSTRFVFPGGTEVGDANPPASISEDSVVWELGAAELMGAGSADSLYVSAALPSPWSVGRTLMIGLAALLVVGLFVFALRKAA